MGREQQQQAAAVGGSGGPQQPLLTAGHTANSNSPDNRSEICHAYWRFRKRLRKWYIASNGLRASQRVAKGGPKPQRLPDGTHVTACYWGITKQQLGDFFDECCEDPQWNDDEKVKTFVKKFVNPKTDGTGMGLALLLNQDDPKQINVLVSHAWQENTKRFFEDTLQHLRDHEVAYICFLSNYQESKAAIDAQIGVDINQSPFTQILLSYTCKRLLIAPNEELREKGCGLYSRLWCDWEITVAASEGLPIHITSRNNLDFLLGDPPHSTRDARCGNPNLPINDDEKLIRDTIENNHPESNKYQAIRLFWVFFCVAWGPRLCVILSQDMERVHWFLGYPLGLIVGLLLVNGPMPLLWTHWHRLRGRDGYDVLDSIIKQAALQSLTYRRFRRRWDLPMIGLAGLLCGIAVIIYSWLFVTEDPIDNPKALAGHILNSIGWGLLLWPALEINGVGPWTGVYLMQPWAQWFCGLGMLCALLAGSYIGGKVFCVSRHAQGALLGVLVGMTVLSTMHKKWRFVLALVLDILIMIGVYFLMLKFGCWMLWRDSFVLVLGVSGILVAPGGSLKQKVFFGVVGFVMVGALLAERETCKLETSMMSQELSQCAE
mmetsp:Transcript_56277/g.111856  ORF Transcript_56277/g.111856 Transcript_56277/m.111856 type:complete len:603 (+) Transcript_56277:37-1845(+)